MSLCDDKQTMPLPYLDSSLYWTKKKEKKEERSICILEKRRLEKTPGAHKEPLVVTLGNVTSCHK